MGYFCRCQPGWTGVDCNVDIDECKSGACSILGTENCVDKQDAYFCQCKSGFEGTNCDIDMDECKTVECKNDGECEAPFEYPGQFVCHCLPGYTGGDVNYFVYCSCVKNGRKKCARARSS